MIACDRSMWKKNMRLGLDHYEEGRIDKIEETRLMRHNYTPQNLTTCTKNVCNICHEYVVPELDSLHMNVLIKDKL